MRLGVIHPDYLAAALTERQWQDWERFNEANPIGELRADWRMEAFQARLMAKLWGGSDPPNAWWPYWDQPDAKELAELAANTEANLEPDGKGGYRWRQPLQNLTSTSEPMEPA